MPRCLAALTAALFGLALDAGFVYASGGLNLGWNDCGGLPASLNKTYSQNCNTCGNFQILVGSFVAPPCVTAMSAITFVLDVQTASPTLADWWNMSPGGCRPSSLSSTADFTGGPYSCSDYWQGGAIGQAAMGSPVGNRGQISGVFALPAEDSRVTSIAEGTEVYSFRVSINNSKTTGLGACTGFYTGACIVFSSLWVNQPKGEPCGSIHVTAPAVRSYVTWMGGIGVDCYGATPARDATWGSVKALYR
jgi:hypothetical protein